jgi:hypothetical protein
MTLFLPGSKPPSSIDCLKMKYLKVDGNEKLGGLRISQLLGISLGPWRSMSIFGLNMPFAIEKRTVFPFPLSPAK